MDRAQYRERWPHENRSGVPGCQGDLWRESLRIGWLAMAKRKSEPERLKGWQEIARFLGQPTSVAERWAKSGMPVTHEGRHIYASPDDLNRWLGSESAGEPVQIATTTTDLGSELKRGLSYVRKHKAPQKKRSV